MVSMPKNERTMRFQTNYDENKQEKIIELGIFLYEFMTKKQVCWDDEKIAELLKNEKSKL